MEDSVINEIGSAEWTALPGFLRVLPCFPNKNVSLPLRMKLGLRSDG